MMAAVSERAKANAVQRATAWRLANPERYRELQKQYYERNKEARKAQVYAQRAAKPEHYKVIRRKHWLKSTYGITPERYDEMLREQGGVCAICKQTDRRGDVALAVDHDHANGQVRGLLCGNCNVAVGLFSDNTERLQNAIAYLEREQ